METHFWRSQILSMAAPARDQQSQVVADLQRLARNGRLIVDSEEAWQRLGDRVLHLATRMRVPRHRTSFEELVRAWREELAHAKEQDPRLAERQEEIEKDLVDELRDSLADLVDRGIFYQGHEWSCRRCRHRNWAGVSALGSTMRCDVCGTDHQLPVDVSLDFRLNEFFSACIREHDTLTVGWALSYLRSEHSRHSFAFVPQAELYRDYPERQGHRVDRELDLLCICDGRLVVGEAKARLESIGEPEIRKLAEVAAEIGADDAILAAFQGEESSMARKIEALQAQVPPTTKAHGIISNWREDPSAYLPGRGGVTVRVF